MSVEGMTTRSALILIDCILARMETWGRKGHFIEFGTYKGRTATLLASRTTERNWFHAVEQSDYLQEEEIMKWTERYTWHRSKSEPFVQDSLCELLGNEKVAFTHHDASHFFDNVATELEHTIPYMDEEGVIVLDDFCDSFSQVRAAYYYLKYARKIPYELLLIGFNKAFLVRESRFDEWESYILESLLENLESYGLECMLVRSDISPHSRNFFVRQREPEEDVLYGTRFWGNRFYKHSADFLNKHPPKH